MRLGGPLFETIDSPDDWVQALRNNGYRAASCPVTPDANDDTVRAYETAAKNADIVIAEVGAWSNPLSSDSNTRSAAIEKCIRGLDLADRIGALCCVNTAGSRGTFSWYGPHPANLTEETFEMIVETTRKIIDEVRPTRSVFTLEPMPWIFPNSPASWADARNLVACYNGSDLKNKGDKMRYVSVRVVDSSGRPQRDTRVGIEVHQFAAGGVKTEYTNSDGLAEFELDVDEGAEITVYVNGSEKVRRGSIRSEYKVSA